MTNTSPAGMREVVRWRDGHIEHVTDELSIEEPLEIRVRGRSVSITMRTPGHDDELVAGFLLSEGLIGKSSDVLRMDVCDRNEDGNVLSAVLAPHVHVDFEKLTRHVFGSSSCGLCGKATIEAVRSAFVPIESDVIVDPNVLVTLPRVLREAQSTFDRTGGLHAAGLFDLRGRLIVAREDVGRHNAVDKVLGHALLHDLLPLDQHVLLVSGRASFEIVQKALAAQVSIVVAVSAPSSLAVEFAEANGQTLIGFLRDQRMNVYSQPKRIDFAKHIEMRRAHA